MSAYNHFSNTIQSGVVHLLLGLHDTLLSRVCVCFCVHMCDCMYSSLGPPAVNKSLVYEWHRTVTRLHNQLQEVHNKFLVQLQNCQEVINMACVSEVERHRVRYYILYIIVLMFS